jgi:hypothetical protein
MLSQHSDGSGLAGVAPVFCSALRNLPQGLIALLAFLDIRSVVCILYTIDQL